MKMSKNQLAAIGAYLQPTILKEFDTIRGDIPRSKMIGRAIYYGYNEVVEE
jgi:hypothetical protein